MKSATDLGGIFIILDISALLLATNYTYRILEDRLGSDQLRGGNGPSRFGLLSVIV